MGAPRSLPYWHDELPLRAGVGDDEPRNGHAHCRALLMPSSQLLTIADGALRLGRWQRVFLVELDGPRRTGAVSRRLREGAVKVKMILPALHGSNQPVLPPIKVLAVPSARPRNAGWIPAVRRRRSRLQDEHVETIDTSDTPDLVVIQVYITSATPAYQLADLYRAKGSYVVLGGLHVTSLPDEAARHGDTIFIGPGEDTWPRFLRDFARGDAAAVYRSTVRTLDGLPPIRRDLIKRHLYLVPNSIVVSRGCPHVCDFCYKEAFFEGGRGFYTQTVDAALAEIERLPGKHLYFLDDHLFGDRRFASALFDGMRGMGRLWQAAGTVNAVLMPGLLEKAVACGLRSLFVGFETLDAGNLSEQRKYQNLRRDYSAAIARLHDAGVMVNASFVFGMDGDGPDVFARTVEWAIQQGVETATFHVLTPYPGTPLYQRMRAQERITTCDWDLYDTRHAVFRPLRMSAEELERGYWWAYREFYTWRSIAARRIGARVVAGGVTACRVRRRLEEVRAALGSRHPREADRLHAPRAGSDPRRIDEAPRGADRRDSTQ
ncbi:MAG: YjbQ family protein [Vicinamibacterales bacterium]